MAALKSPLADPRRKRVERLSFFAAVKMREAAELEEAVALECPKTLPRCRSILAISACSLWWKGGDAERAQALAKKFLRSRGLTADGRVWLLSFVALNPRGAKAPSPTPTSLAHLRCDHCGGPAVEGSCFEVERRP